MKQIFAHSSKYNHRVQTKKQITLGKKKGSENCSTYIHMQHVRGIHMKTSDSELIKKSNMTAIQFILGAENHMKIV